MAEAIKKEPTNALKEVKRLCKEFGFTGGMIKGSLARAEQSNVYILGICNDETACACLMKDG